RAIRCVTFGEARGVTEASWVEKGMRFVDPGVYIANLDAGSAGGPAPPRSPSIRRVDDFVALTQVGVIKCVVLSLLHHRRGRDFVSRRPVELHGDCVERNIVLTGYF